jgi:hypothetical protein
LTAAQNPDRSLAQTVATANTNPGATGGVPLALRPARGGLLGVVDKIADALTGTTRPEIYKDDQGNEFVYHPNLSRGQQWARIGAELGQGAAAGFAAGRGAGGGGRAALAGFQVAAQNQAQGKQEENEMEAKVRQDTTDKANNQMLRMKIAEEIWRGTRLQVDATHHDIEFAQGQADRLTKAGATPLGYASHPGDISRLQKVNPDLAQDLVNNHSLEFIPRYVDGKPDGFTVYKTPEKYRDTLLPPGAEFPTFNKVTGVYDWHNDANSVSQGEIDDRWNAAGADALKYKSDKAEIELKEQQKKTGGATQAKEEFDVTAGKEKLPLEKKEIQAKTAASYGAAAESNAKAAQTSGQTAGGVPTELTTETPVNGVRANYLAALPDQDRSLVQAIGEGRKADVGSYAMGRSPEARRIAMEVTTAYPGYDFTRAPTYLKTREAFTSGKPADAINALNTALEHMQQMYDNADWLTTAPLISGYQRAIGNQRAIDLKDAKTALVDELGKAYKAGALTIEDKKSWSERINAWSPHETKGNAVSFIKLLRGKIDSYDQQWKAGTPPGSVAPIQIFSPGAQAAYDHIMKNQNQVPAPGPAAAPAPGAAPTAPPSQPLGATNEVHQGGPTGPLIGHMVNGKYVPLATGAR